MFYGANRPGAKVLSRGCWISFLAMEHAGRSSRMSMIAIKAIFSETDFHEDLKKFDVPHGWSCMVKTIKIVPIDYFRKKNRPSSLKEPRNFLPRLLPHGPSPPRIADQVQPADLLRIPEESVQQARRASA